MISTEVAVDTRPPPSLRGENARPWHRQGVVIAALLTVGIGLRLAQYLANRPLWLDEAMLVLNLVRRSYRELLEPLAYHQLAPPAFLFAERFAVTAFGHSEFSLRLFPLLAGLASIFLFWALARRALPATAVPVALLLFAASTRLIHYSSEVKQYSSDVAIALLLLLLGFWILERAVSWRRAAVLGVAGGAALWISRPAVFVLAGLFTALVGFFARTGRWAELRRLAGAFALWAAGGIPALLHAMHSLPPGTARVMFRFWQPGFMPMPPRSLEEALWMPRAFVAFAWDAAGFRLPLLALLLAGLGGVWALRRRPDTLLFLTLPFLFALLASALGLYPFGGARIDSYRPFFAGMGRVLLFLVPLFLLLIAAGAEYLRQRLPGRTVLASYLLLLVLLLHPLWALVVQFPYEREDVRSLALYLAEHRRADERIWIHSRAGPQFRYYAARLGFPDEAYHVAGWIESDGGAQPEDLARLQTPGRIWLLFAKPGGQIAAPAGDRAVVLRYLEGRGTLVQEIGSNRASLHLYTVAGPSAGERETAGAAHAESAAGEDRSNDRQP